MVTTKAKFRKYNEIVFLLIHWNLNLWSNLFTIIYVKNGARNIIYEI